jgi:hypothetical protein
MLLNRNQSRDDPNFDRLTQAILERDQPKTTDLFVKMVQGGRSTGEALDWVSMRLATEFEDTGKSLPGKRQMPLAAAEVEAIVGPANPCQRCR